MDLKTDREKLVKAFDHMVESVNQAMHDAEEAIAPSVDEMVGNAQTIAHELFSLSKEESGRLGKALKRDIKNANKVLNQQRKELKDWLSFDLTLVEDKFIELIDRAADKTWLDFRDFENEEIHASLYRTGEVCSAGTLCCRDCGQTMNLSKSSHIPPCPKCHHTEFYRVIS
ncbi:MAG: zinc ribbon-containing protein [Gammaproteobacteria bacterium]